MTSSLSTDQKPHTAKLYNTDIDTPDSRLVVTGLRVSGDGMGQRLEKGKEKAALE